MDFLKWQLQQAKMSPKSKYQLPYIHILLCLPVAHYNAEKYTKGTAVPNSPFFGVWPAP